MATWQDVCAFDAIPQRGARTLQGPDGQIAVFRTATDTVFAILDRCPHKGGPLSQGIVHGSAVTCPLHNWVIDLESGEALKPDQGCVRRYPAKVENGRVLIVTVPALTEAA